MKKYYLPPCPTHEVWEANEKKIYNENKKEYLAGMGIDENSTNVTVGEIQIDIRQNDFPDIVAMKVRNALEGKDFIETEYTRSNQKLLNRGK